MSKGTETRAKVLEAAMELINSRGLQNTSIQDIIDATGVKKGNLYFHFTSKEDLGLALIREAGDRYLEYLAGRVKSADPLGKVRDILHGVLAYHRSRGFVGGCIFGNTALEMGDAEGPYADLVREIFGQWEHLLAEFLRGAERDGTLPAGVRPGPMARHIVAAMEGAIMMARLYKKEEPIVECIGHVKKLLGMK